MSRIAAAVNASEMALQVKSIPLLAHWFLLDSLMLANQANRDGMHANALALTRQCVEALSVIELGLCGHPKAEVMLGQWDRDELTAGQLRNWLQQNVWASYGSGLWNEPWSDFMGQFAKAIQPYAHYGRGLAHWQTRLVQVYDTGLPDQPIEAIIELRPHAYDSQKATRITLFHALLTYLLGRVLMASTNPDPDFAAIINRLGVALGKSRYLDGHQTSWSQQFWATVWDRNTGVLLE